MPLYPEGTAVRYIGPNREWAKDFTAGNVYVVGGKYHTANSSTVAVVADDAGTNNGFDPGYFVLAGGPW